jgi:hypothetical protein
LGKKNDDELIREVCGRIDSVIERHRKSERIIIVVLIVWFITGLALIGYGASIRSWHFLGPGGVLGVSIVLPVRRLIKLREDNLRLQILPQLLRLAESQESKALVAKLIQRLIEQV